MKLSRAQHHLQEIQEVIAGWVNEAEKTVSEGPDPEEPGANGAWVDPPPLPSQQLSLLIGDCLQCMRTSLDHLAFELAAAFTAPMTDAVEKDSEFPIFSDEPGQGASRFCRVRIRGPHKGHPAPGSGLAKTAGMDPQARAIIEGLQPYRAAQAYESETLWRLHRLNMVDKHRVLHVVGAVSSGAIMALDRAENVAGIDPPAGGGYFRPFSGPIEGRTQTMRWTGTLRPIIPGKQMRVNFLPALYVAFDPTTPLVGGADVLDVLREVNDHIVSDVLPPLVGFLK